MPKKTKATFSPHSGCRKKAEKLGFNAIQEAPAKLHKENHDQTTPTATVLEHWSLAFPMQDGPPIKIQVFCFHF